VIADVDPLGPDVAREVEALGQRALFVETDVTDEAAVRAMVNRSKDMFGRIDILVCCAGILGLEAPFLEQSGAQFDKVMRINVYGVYYAHQAAIPHMLEQGWGRCVTITSAARYGSPNQRYSVSKAQSIRLSGRWATPTRSRGFRQRRRAGTRPDADGRPAFTAEHLANPGNPIGRIPTPRKSPRWSSSSPRSATPIRPARSGA
jgi:NAD(P)-dependent dehydrogenase (short-subunit alcohol dehydrogenase family)